MKNRAQIADMILSRFDGAGDEQFETWIKLQFCQNHEDRPAYEALIDDVIDNMLDAGYLRCTVVQHGDWFGAALVLTVEGYDHVAHDRAERKRADQIERLTYKASLELAYQIELLAA